VQFTNVFMNWWEYQLDNDFLRRTQLTQYVRAYVERSKREWTLRIGVDGAVGRRLRSLWVGIALWKLRFHNNVRGQKYQCILPWQTTQADARRQTVKSVSLRCVLICLQTAVRPACPCAGTNQNNSIKQGRKRSLWEALVISVVHVKLFLESF
jgi:hypothetical protein